MGGKDYQVFEVEAAVPVRFRVAVRVTAGDEPHEIERYNAAYGTVTRFLGSSPKVAEEVAYQCAHNSVGELQESYLGAFDAGQAYDETAFIIDLDGNEI